MRQSDAASDTTDAGHIDEPSSMNEKKSDMKTPPTRIACIPLYSPPISYM